MKEQLTNIGVKIAAARGAARTLYLDHTLKAAAVTPAENELANRNVIAEGEAQAYAQIRTMLPGRAARDRRMLACWTASFPPRRCALWGPRAGLLRSDRWKRAQA